jgi:hypothetical protein
LNVRLSDVTSDTIEGTFDIIVAGELIEHLGRPESSSSSVGATWLLAGGLVLTTPNPYYLDRVRDALLGGSRENKDHVSLWFAGGIAEMVEREGLRLDRCRGVSVVSARTATGRLLLALRLLIQRLPAGAEALCRTLISRVCHA